jgi:hypothetical protein
MSYEKHIERIDEMLHCTDYNIVSSENREALTAAIELMRAAAPKDVEIERLHAELSARATRLAPGATSALPMGGTVTNVGDTEIFVQGASIEHLRSLETKLNNLRAAVEHVCQAVPEYADGVDLNIRKAVNELRRASR